MTENFTNLTTLIGWRKKSPSWKNHLSLQEITRINYLISAKISYFGTELSLNQFTKPIKIVEFNFQINNHYFRFSLKSRIISTNQVCATMRRRQTPSQPTFESWWKTSNYGKCINSLEKPKQSIVRIVVSLTSNTLYCSFLSSKTLETIISNRKSTSSFYELILRELPTKAKNGSNE